MNGWITILFRFPPPLLPTTEEDMVNQLRLLRSRRVGIATYRRLIAEHGSAAAALDALPEIAKGSGVSDYVIYPIERVHAELDAGRKAGAQLIIEGSADYPAALSDISDSPLFCGRSVRFRCSNNQW